MNSNNPKKKCNICSSLPIMPRGGVHAALLNKLTFSPVEFLPGQASIALDVGGKVPTGPLTVSVSPGQGMAPNVTVTLEVSSPGGQGEERADTHMDVLAHTHRGQQCEVKVRVLCLVCDICIVIFVLRSYTNASELAGLRWL